MFSFPRSVFLFLTIPIFFAAASLRGETWYDADIGTVGSAGSSSYDAPSDSFTVLGTGAQVGGTADGMHFVYLPLAGNMEIISKVVSQTNTNGYAKAGITFRESTAAGSKHVTLAVSPSSGVSFVSRSTTNGNTSVTLGSASAAPLWLRLVRSGSTLAGYQSADGITWELVGQRSFSMANILQVGLVVSSYNQGSLSTAVFDHVSAFSNVPQVNANLKLWLRGDAGLVLDGSSKVSSWKDQSGNGFHAVQSTSGNRPLWVGNGLNGQPIVRFNSTNLTYLSIPNNSALMPAQVSIVSVVKRSSGSGNAIVAEKYNSGSSTGYSLQFNTGTAVRPVINSNNNLTGTLSSNTFGVLEQIYDQVNNKLFLNGTQSTTSAYTTAITSTSNPVYVGGRAASNSLDGDIAELLVYDRALTVSERQEIEAYFYQKYGIGTSPQLASATASLPTGTYATTQNIVLTAPAGSSIYYTTNGSTPSSASTLYTGTISVSSSTTIKAIAIRDGYQSAAAISETYIIESATAAVARSGLQLWLKADSLSGSGGSSVSLWEDQSGNKVNVTQGTSGNRPTLQTSVINGKPVVRFDGSNDFLQGNVTAGLGGTTETMIAVYRNAVNVSNAKILSRPYRSSGWTIPYISWSLDASGGAADGKPVSGLALSSTNSTYSGTSTALATNTANVVVSHYDGANHRFVVNGTEMNNTNVSGTISYGDATTFCVGGRSTYSNGEYLNGDIAEVLFYNRAISNVERTDIEAYVYGKYGVGVQPTVDTPVSNIPTGTYAVPQLITLSSTPGAQIYYTTNGATPTISSAVYSTTIPVSSTTTVKAIAFKAGYQTSSVMSEKISIDSTTSPITRSGLSLWLKADSESLSSGTAVSSWEDQSGNKVNTIQSISTSQPTYQTGGINGKPVIRFDGDDFLEGTATAGMKPTNHTILAVCKKSATNNYAHVISMPWANSGWSSPYCSWELCTQADGPSNNEKPYSTLALNATTRSYIMATTGVTLSTPFYTATSYDGATHKLYVNGSTYQSSAAGSIAYGNAGLFSVGSQGSYSNGTYLTGDIAEVLFYNRVLTTTERQEIEAYFYQKYGVGTIQALVAPTSSIATGTYGSTQYLYLSAAPGSTIYYTTNGTTPTTSSSVYSNYITIPATATIKAYAVKSGFPDSSVATYTVTIDPSSSYVSTSGLKLWLRADSGVTAVSSKVDTWADQSGNGNNAVQTTAGNKPTLVASAINGKPVLRFDSTAHTYMSVAHNSGLSSSQTSVIIVGKRSSGTTNAMLIEKYGTNSGFTQYFSNANTLTTNINGTAAATGTLTSNTPGILAQIYNQTDNRVYVNGSVGTPTAYITAITANTGAVYLGGRGNTLSLDGDIAEVLLYDRAITNTERDEISAYLFVKYGLGTKPALSSPVSGLQSGTYDYSREVTLTAAPGAVIYYTTDDTAPTTTSTLYTTPIYISSTTTLRAKAVKPGYSDSAEINKKIIIDTSTSPIVRSGLQLWLKADSLSGSSGSAVSLWEDQSGNEINVTQGTSGNRPTLQTSVINSKPVVRFDGSNDFLQGSTSAGMTSSSETIIAVYRNGSNGANTKILSRPYRVSGWTSPYVSWSLDASNASDGKPVSTVALSSSTTSQAGSSAALALNTPQLAVTHFNALTHRLILNGSEAASSSVSGGISYGDSSTFCVGSRGTYSNGEYLNGDIAEILFYNRSISDDERREMESYFYTKYGVGNNPKVPQPTINIQGGTFKSQVPIILTSSQGNVQIRYTLNGIDPSIGSTLYSGPFYLYSTTTLKAKGFRSGFVTSDTATWNFTFDPTIDFVRNGLQLWLKSDQGVEVDGSSKISRWQDQSGEGNHAVQVTGANQPALISSALNGKPVLRFNSTALTYLAIPNSAALNPAQLTSFVVAKRSSGTSSARILSKFDTSTGYATDFKSDILARGRLNAIESTGTVSLGNWYFFTHVYDQINNVFYTNGTVSGSTASTSAIVANTIPLYIGGQGLTNSLDGDIAEVLLFNRPLSSSERQQVHSYLNNKYALVVVAASNPLFSIAGGTLSAPTQVALSVPEGSVVYYTVDGSTPTSGSLLYTGPISVLYTTTIKAIAIKAGAPSSSVVTATYTLDPGTWPGPGSSPGDVTAPTITIERPTNAILQ